MGLMLPDYLGNMCSQFLFLWQQQHVIMAIQGKIVCTERQVVGMGYRGVYEQYYNKNHIRNRLILFEGGLDPKSENHIRNVLI